MLQVFDSAASHQVLPIATWLMLPSTGYRVSAQRNCVLSELNHWAWVYPCRYYTHGVATVSVRLRASVSG
jgi:hypothetical protein